MGFFKYIPWLSPFAMPGTFVDTGLPQFRLIDNALRKQAELPIRVFKTRILLVGPAARVARQTP
jgi:hypothetical protein